jgi:hypothetical protein
MHGIRVESVMPEQKGSSHEGPRLFVVGEICHLKRELASELEEIVWTLGLSALVFYMGNELLCNTGAKSHPSLRKHSCTPSYRSTSISRRDAILARDRWLLSPANLQREICRASNSSMYSTSQIGSMLQVQEHLPPAKESSSIVE